MDARFSHRAGRSYVPLVFFFAAFVVLISYVVSEYLVPAMSSASTATPGEKAGLAAYSRLLLAVVLVLLISGLLLTYGIGRRWRRPPEITKTEYIDAWAEAGKRMKDPPNEA